MSKLTLSEVTDLLDTELARGKQERSRLPFGAADNMPPSITIIGQKRQIARPPLSWGSREEQNRVMEGVARVARVLDAQAVMLLSDATFMHVEKVAGFLGIPAPSPDVPGSLDAFQKAYGRIWRGPLMNRDMRNLPTEFWQDSLIVWIKGPEIGSHGRTAAYRADPDAPRKVRFDAMQPLDGQSVHSIGMMVDWWTLPDDDPGLAYAREVTALVMTTLQ